MAKRIFSSKGKTPDVLYDAEILEKCVEDAILEAKLSKDAKLDNRFADMGCKTFVVATATLENGAEPFLLRSYSANAEVPSPFDCTILQACRATSAAPSFFDPMIINDTTFGERTNLDYPILQAARATSTAPTFFPTLTNGKTFGEKTTIGGPGSEAIEGDAILDRKNDLALSDGGLTANNATIEAILEAGKIPGWSRRFAAIVSVGTGKGTPPKLTRSKGFAYKMLAWVSQWQALRLDVAKYCADLVTDTEATHARVRQGLQLLNNQDAYFRLNADKVGQFELDDLVNMPKMITFTEDHIRDSSEQKNAREKLARILLDPEYARDQMMNERHGLSGTIPTTEATFISSLDSQATGQSPYGYSAMSGGRGRIPWTWPDRNNEAPVMHSLIFYNYDEKTKSLWNHKGHDRKDQSVLMDRRDEGESAIAVLELESKLSFVSSAFVKHWKIKTHDIPEILRAQSIMINGFKVHCEKYVWLSFRCAGFGMKTQRTWFRVLNTDGVEVVFGCDAFTRNAFHSHRRDLSPQLS